MMNLIRFFFGCIDAIVYSFLAMVFQLVIDLANVEIFTDSTIDHFAKRIYLILGLVMLFKIIISFVQILINPDKMDDKEQGVTNILGRVVISLVLIFMVPSIFDFARTAQNKLIPIIPKVVLGSSIDVSSDASDQMSKIGEKMAFQTFLAFFNYDNLSCDDGSIQGTGSNLTSTLAGGTASSIPDIISVGTAVKYKNINKKDGCSNDDNEYKYSYRMIISTAVGVYLLLTMVTTAISVGVRAIKLAICEFIAPIPIASYIDPKLSKQTFENWVDITIKTYFDLFASLIVVFFVAFVFNEVFKVENISIIYSKLGSNPLRYGLVTVFIILALIRFMRDAPKFISDLLGVKDGGSISGIFRDVGSMIRGTGATIDTFRSNLTSQRERLEAQGRGRGETFFRSLGSGIAGAASANARLLRAVAQGKNPSEIRDLTFGAAVAARNSRNYRNDVVYAPRDEHGNPIYTRADYRADRRRQRLGIPSTDSFYGDRAKAFSDMLGAANTTIEFGNKKKEEVQGELKGLVKTHDSSGHVLGKLASRGATTTTAPDGSTHVNLHGVDLQEASLAQVRAMAKIRVGENYNGSTWTAEDAAVWADLQTEAEKRGKYLETARRLKSHEAEASRDHADLVRAMRANATMFNGKLDPSDTETIGQKLLNSVNAKLGLTGPRALGSIDDLINHANTLISSRDPASVSQLADLYSTVKDNFDKLVTDTNEAAKNAQTRQQLFQQADSNNGNNR